MDLHPHNCPCCACATALRRPGPGFWRSLRPASALSLALWLVIAAMIASHLRHGA